MVRAMDEIYTEGGISIKLLPVKRSIVNLKNGHIDFHIPYIPNPRIPEGNLPYTFASEPVVDVAFVLYTRPEIKMSSMDNLEKIKHCDFKRR